MFLLISFILLTLVTESQSQDCCAPGAVHDGERCVACEAGKVSLFDAASGKASECLYCDPCLKHYSAAGATYCESCGAVAGEYWQRDAEETITGNCLKCPTGTIRRAEKIDPTIKKALLMGTMLTRALATSCSSYVREDCELCETNEGYYSNEFAKAECKRCPDGKQVDRSLFETALVGVTPACIKTAEEWKEWAEEAERDPNHREQTDFTARCAETFACKNCPSGYAGKQGVCYACPEGSMQASAGQTSCTQCEGGKYTDQSQQTSCKPCETGKATNVEGQMSCQPCEKGQAQASTAQTACAGCAAGTYSDQIGQTGCKPCAKGKAVEKVGQQVCDSCKAGSAQPLKGQISCVSFNR